MGFKHGMWKTPTYHSWQGMKNRCLNQNAGRYRDYGGRGIKVCKRWMEFENFFADMGERPDGKTLDRIDNNNNYEPDNCRWATPEEQSNNARNNIVLNHKGLSLTLSQWARRLDINMQTLYDRIVRRKWPVNRALETQLVSKNVTGHSLMEL